MLFIVWQLWKNQKGEREK